MIKRLPILLIFLSFQVIAQEGYLARENLNDFESQDGNWRIVGAISMDRSMSVQTPSTVKPKVVGVKRKKKKKKVESVPKKAEPISFQDGQGVLLNISDAARKSNLTTKWEHGDMKLDLEVMIPKKGNSGIYLQGRYELQIADSWNVKQARYSDFGGIYKNSGNASDKSFAGVPPLNNAAKAPGLWQKLKIHFQAPKFDGSGNKITNAKFVSVELNGVRIHNNVEVMLPTDGALFPTESSIGPLMIQGDHGPVAFRNIHYTLFEESSVQLSDLTYKIYKGEIKGLDEMAIHPVVSEGSADQIDVHIIDEEDNYGITYSGVLKIPIEDSYTFTVPYTGGVELIIDGKSIVRNNTAQDDGELVETINLSQGNHSFSLINIKSAGWRPARLGLLVETKTTNPKSFHTFDSYPPILNAAPPINVEVGSEPQLHRGFVDFMNDGKSERLSHTIAVGTPAGVHFIYDLAAGNLIGSWRGDFVDATPMWRRRGDGSYKPNGAIQWTFNNQPIAELETVDASFPKTGDLPDFKPKGYSMDKVSGMPIFKHTYKGVEIENKITPNAENTHLIHELSFSKSGLTSWYYMLASGEVTQLSDGSFLINDQQYYIKMLSGQTATIRKVNGNSELVLPIDGSQIKYEIVW